jgi:hypothetical protein
VPGKACRLPIAWRSNPPIPSTGPGFPDRRSPQISCWSSQDKLRGRATDRHRGFERNPHPNHLAEHQVHEEGAPISRERDQGPAAAGTIGPGGAGSRPRPSGCRISASPKECTMGASIQTIVRRTLESPAGGLVTTALAWAVMWPWLPHRRWHPRPLPDRPAVAGGCQPWRLGPVRRGVTDQASPRRASPARSWPGVTPGLAGTDPRPGGPAASDRLRAARVRWTASRVASLVRMAPTSSRPRRARPSTSRPASAS